MNADAATQLLLACLHRDQHRLDAVALPPDDRPEWDALVTLASAQRVRPLLHRRLTQHAANRRVPSRVLDTLGGAARQIAITNLAFLREVQALGNALADRNIPLIVLKGVHLAAAVYDSPSLREMTDIDVLVEPRHLAPTAAAVEARGYRALHGGDIAVAVATTGQHLTRLVKPPMLALEVHWGVTPVEGPCAIDAADLWTRAVPLTVGGERVLALGREDLLLHLCYHAAYLHQFRFGLRPFCDLAVLLEKEGAQMDWRTLAARARAWRWDRGVYLALRLARDLVGARVPEDALNDLQPRAIATPPVVAAARVQVLSESSAGLILPTVARLGGGESAADRLRHLRGRVLPPRGEMARIYGRQAATAALPWLYVRRAATLTRRYAAVATRLLLGRDTVLNADAARASLLREWLGS